RSKTRGAPSHPQPASYDGDGRGRRRDRREASAGTGIDDPPAAARARVDPAEGDAKGACTAILVARGPGRRSVPLPCRRTAGSRPGIATLPDPEVPAPPPGAVGGGRHG